MSQLAIDVIGQLMAELAEANQRIAELEAGN